MLLDEKQLIFGSKKSSLPLKSLGFRLFLVLAMTIIGLNPISSFADIPQTQCKSHGSYIKVKLQYFSCIKSGKQFIVKKVTLTGWQKSLFSSSRLTNIPNNLVDPIENAAGWASIPFLKEMNWSTDEGRFPLSDGTPTQNGDGDKVMLMGDSLAAAIGPAFLSLQKIMNWNLRVVFRSSCQIAETKVSYHSPSQLEKCDQARADRVKAIDDFKPKILILIEDPLNPILPSPGATILQTWQKSFAKTIAGYSSEGAMKIVLISRPVGVPKPLQDCVKRKSQLSTDCFGKSAKDANLRVAQKTEVEKIGGKFLDLSPLLCINGVCPPFIANALVYRDHVHFTNAFCQLLGLELEGFFRSL
jgi:hypothetical protein